MTTLRKWWKMALALAALLVAVQIGSSMLVRTRRVHAYLTMHLERAFGRPVEVGRFGVALLPAPRLDAERITVGEDPAFGNEYFLRADNLSASLRWAGLLRGHFEFGTLSLSRPSLILVRNNVGRWNLESWLPSSQAGVSAATHLYGPPRAVTPVNRLRKIEFDEGRVSFKDADEKLPFAFVGVSGSVDQVAPGRWLLRLDAEPWRSGVVLQSVGTLRVQGSVAGTSARLQPAEINVHWEDVSLADLFRLLHGNDSGVRGSLTLNGSLKSGAPADAADASRVDARTGDWSFAVEARASQIHRWDLGERNDNPRLRLGVAGRWSVATGKVRAERITVEGPRSNLRGTAIYQSGPTAGFELHVDSAGIQATDLLAWLRAFQPGINDGISTDQFFTGALAIRGWPLELEHAAFSSNGGVLRIPGLEDPIRIGPIRGGRERNSLVFGPVRVALGGTVHEVIAPRKRRIAALMQNAADITFVQDLSARAGSISIEGHVRKAENLFRAAAAFGHPINLGWELTGEALAVTQWEWQQPFDGRWSGRILFNRAQLVVAGLNQPLDIQASTLNWDHGRRSVEVTKVSGLGGLWSGSIHEVGSLLDGKGPHWNFDLTADRMNAAELDR
ncbi:MAG TPA: AsmA family protein, partial [Candidatus Methylomirabilis sp.]|nr:AsmA family protein [Candidatus Methylomirabilis sp.]